MRIASKTHNPWIWIAGAVLTVASAISADEAGRNRGSQPLTSTTIAPAQRTVTTPGSFALSLDSDLDLGGFVFKQGYPFLHNEGGSSYGNTALGVNALISATPGTPYSSSGAFNSSFGHNALRNNSTGLTNSALGWMTLYYNTTGYRNTATGPTHCGETKPGRTTLR